MKPRLLDLFCGAGGASMGYHRAGFDVTGVDVAPQPNYPTHYPLEFVQGDALEYLADHGHEYDAIHASPPCQAFTAYRRRKGAQREHPNLIPQTRELLQDMRRPYVIENVPGAPLENPAQLCGSSFGLDIRRHRLFETNWLLMVPPCDHGWQKPRFPQATNRENLRSTVEVGAYRTAHLAADAMGIDWMTLSELSQAIPPAFTAHIGWELRELLREAAA